MFRVRVRVCVCVCICAAELDWIGLDRTEVNGRLLFKPASLPTFVCLDFSSPLDRSLAASSPRPQETKQTVLRGYTACVPVLSPRRPDVPPVASPKATIEPGISLLLLQTVRDDKVPRIMD